MWNRSLIADRRSSVGPPVDGRLGVPNDSIAAILGGIKHLDDPDYRQSLQADADLTRRVSLEPNGNDLGSEPPVDVAVILGLSWRSNEPMVRIRRRRAETSTLEPLIGQAIQYRPTGRRRCLGHAPFRKPKVDYLDCLRPPADGGKRCDRCAAAEAVFASSLHHAHTRELSMIDPAVREHLQQPNLLYIAGFRDGSIKVGTTTETRKQQRLAEQGAWRAQLVATASDGVAVRQLEDLVTELLAIPQSVSIGRKLDGLAVSSAAEAAEREQLLTARIEAAGTQVRQIIGHAGDDRFVASAIDWQAPAHDHRVWNRVHRYPLLLDEGAHQIEVVDAIGRAVAFRRTGSAGAGDPDRDDVFVADIGRLFGVELELGDHGATEVVVQDSLF